MAIFDCSLKIYNLLPLDERVGRADLKRTIKEAVDKRFQHDDHNQLRRHLNDYIAAYKFARRLKTLKSLTPYEFICKQ